MSWLSRARLILGSDLTLGVLLERLASLYGDRALIEEAADDDGPELRLTYRQAAEVVATRAAGLATTIAPGDRVVLALPNGYDVLLSTLAVSRAGGIPVPVNPHMRAAEIDDVVADSGAALVIRSVTELPVALESGRRQSPAAPGAGTGDCAAILYTSGTTGKPKGAELSHRSLLNGVPAAALWPSGWRRDEAVVGLPVAHVMGLTALLGLAAAGIPVYGLRRFRPVPVLDAIERRRATVFVGVPAMYRMLLDAGAEERDLRSVRLWASGADVMPADLAERFKRMGALVTLPLVPVDLGHAVFAEGYGMVELGGAVASRVSPPCLPARVGGVLTPLPGYRLKVVDEDGRAVRPGATGQLLVKGPGVLRRYHDDPDATRAVLTDDGWLRTGDLARRGPLGMVLFAGRDKDVIKHGGYSVFASEVERALEEHPAVAEVAVVGVTDTRMGQIPVAAVRLRPGALVSVDELDAFARSRLADYKAPRRLVIVDDLPRTGTQKVKKSDLLHLFD